jgi:hypothetical protein
MATEMRNVEIGFNGGQVATMRMADDALKSLRKALDSADGWTDVSAQDAELALDTRQVVFVRVEGGDQSIGFSGS